MIKQIDYLLPFILTFVIDYIYENQRLTTMSSKTVRLYTEALSFFATQTDHMNSTFHQVKKQVLNTSFFRYLGDKYNEYTAEIRNNKPIIILPSAFLAHSLQTSLTAKSLIDLAGSLSIRAPSLHLFSL